MTVNDSIRLTEIRLHPLKSGAISHVRTARVEAAGLCGDRQVMVVTPTGGLVTARDYPQLLSVECILDGEELVLHAPGMDPLVCSLPTDADGVMSATIWGDTIDALRAPAADLWISSYLATPARLVGVGAVTHRKIAGGDGRPVGFADAAPLLLINAASLDDLAARSGGAVAMDRFRPNVVISGAPALVEDRWRRIRIGAIEFDVVAPCDRCNMVLLDPQDPSRAPDGEPLATLSRYRRDAQGQVYFGQLLVPRTEGRLHVGDPVEVLETGDPPSFIETAARPIALIDSALLPSRSPGGSQSLDLRCVDRISEGGDAVTFRFESAQPGSALPDYAPGQYLTLTFPANGQEQVRCYTLSSSPSRAGPLAITVKRGGTVSAALHDSLKLGDVLRARGPAGAFHLFARPARKLCFLSAGSGITPFLSMLRWIADRALPVDILFHHSARSEAEVISGDELNLLARQMGGRMRTSFRFTATGDPRFSAGDVAVLCPDAIDRAIFACGPAGFLDAVREGVEAIPGFDPANLLTETFNASGAVAPVQNEPTPYRVHFARSGRTVEGEGSPSLLSLARAAGIALPSSCEAGLCGTCRVRVIDGDWRLAHHCADPQRSILSPSEKAEGVVLACATCPVGDLEIDL